MIQDTQEIGIAYPNNCAVYFIWISHYLGREISDDLRLWRAGTVTMQSTVP